MPAPRVGAMAVVIVVAAVYAPTLWGYFVDSDWNHVAETWRFEQHSLAQIWTEPREWYYRPVFLSVFGLLSLAFGPYAALWHGVALVVHAANVLLVRALLRRTGIGALAATLGALAFGLYPRNPEAVAWLCALSGPMAALFGLLAAHVALSTRITPFPRALLCGLCWGVAILSKEEPFGLVVVLPLLPVLLRHLKRTAEAIQWAGGCLISLGIPLWIFLAMARRCQLPYGTLSPEPNVHLLRRSLSIPLYTMGDPLSSEVVFDAWFLIPLALVAFAVWMRYPSLRIGLLWLFAVGIPIGAGLGKHDAEPRFAYLPSVGLAACLAAVVERLGPRGHPRGALTWTVLAAFFSASMHLGSLPLWLAGTAVLAACLWLAPHAPRPGHATVLYLIGARFLYTALRILTRYLGSTSILAPEITLVAPFCAVGALWLLRRWNGRIGVGPESVAEMLICSCAIFWTGLPGFVWLLLVVAVARVVRGDPGYRADGLAPLRRAERLFQRHAALALSVLVLVVWLPASLRENLAWMRTGRAVNRTVHQASPMLQSLPESASVLVVPPQLPRRISDCSVRFHVFAPLMLGRSDLRVFTRVPNSTATIPEQPRKPDFEYAIVWSDGSDVHMKRLR